MRHDFKNLKGRTSRGKTRFRGIGRFAAEHGRNPSHVYRVLTGERRSPLKDLFLAWQAKHPTSS
jgi:hypothetical protein